ncbi:hypothetical protein [Streptomyces camelliae]|uniref:Uncharacterized protein n=1 Tax=Streptomyces camelliae TaxID=3004093 RepID=A0ABY7PFV8_9ACTN|nr:hypothetical protein [Streptomyces sp. HUAS 2-6]WBO69534.1 hypothetical protein O1G22_41445 [Streptomyces sp. HUAS 2-6]
MTTADDFRAVSELLTGECPLGAQLSDAYQQRLKAAYPADLTGLIDACRAATGQTDPAAALPERLDVDPALARVARETIALWYTSQFTRPDGTLHTPGSPQQGQWPPSRQGALGVGEPGAEGGQVAGDRAARDHHPVGGELVGGASGRPRVGTPHLLDACDHVGGAVG